MKKALCFMLKALIVREVFTFLPWFLDYVEKRHEKKVVVNFKIYDVTNWTTNNYNADISNTIPKSSKHKGKKTMKFCQLIEYNMINIFLEKSYTKCEREDSPRLFFKKSKLNMSGSTAWIFIKFVYIACSSRGRLRYINNKVLTICFYFIERFSKKLKEMWN